MPQVINKIAKLKTIKTDVGEAVWDAASPARLVCHADITDGGKVCFEKVSQCMTAGDASNYIRWWVKFQTEAMELSAKAFPILGYFLCSRRVLSGKLQGLLGNVCRAICRQIRHA